MYPKKICQSPTFLLVSGSNAILKLNSVKVKPPFKRDFGEESESSQLSTAEMNFLLSC